MARIDWCTRHVNSTNFYSVFFTEEFTFYLETLQEVDGLKLIKSNINYSKNKRIKIGAWVGVSYQRKTSLFYMKITRNQ